ncbi:MAG TPA: helix-turn-helix domain-containing protein [Acidimicrobiales bacterium]|nr:helix-turn-helix domain-containing protein [Acidimicrobiales bacterium]
MRKFRRKGREVVPSTVPAGAAPTFSAPPPTTPVEVGLALRSARERAGLGLDDVRDRTGVPKVDLDALEQGRFELLLVEQAAVVALWRFAELVGLDPTVLVGVLRSQWPNRALAVDAFRLGPSPDSMPLARLKAARQLLAPITGTRQLGVGSSSVSGLGLSEATRQLLAATSSSTAIAVAAIGPGRSPRRPRSRAAGARQRTADSDDEDGQRRAEQERGGPAAPGRADEARAAGGTPVARAAPQDDDLEAHGGAAPPSSSPARPESTAADAPRLLAAAPVASGTTGGPEHARLARQPGWAGNVARVIAERFGIEPFAEPYEMGGEDLAT